MALGAGTEYGVNVAESSDSLAYIGKKTEVAPQPGVIIPDCEAGISPAHIVVQYRKDMKAYFIKDNSSELGTFLKVDKPLEIKHGYVFAFGESSMAVTKESANKIICKFLSGSKEKQTL